MSPERIAVIVGSSPEQCVVRALAACKCNEPENHPTLAPHLLAAVTANDGEPSWPFVLVLPYEDTDGLDVTAEGIRIYTLGDSPS